MVGRHQRKHREVRRDVLAGELHLRLDRHRCLAGFLDETQLVEDPLVVFPEQVRGRLVEDLRQGRAKNPQAGGVARGDLAELVERHDAVGHRLEHRLVVVLHVLHVGEELGVLEGDRDLRRERAQARLVLRAEGASALVEHLRDPDRLAVLVHDRHAQDRAREEARLAVEGRVEAQVRVGVRDVDGLAGGEDGAGDAEVVREADLRGLDALTDLGPELLRLLVVQEQGRALGVEHARRSPSRG